VEEGYLTFMFDVDFVCMCVRHLVCVGGGGSDKHIYVPHIYAYKYKHALHTCTNALMCTYMTMAIYIHCRFIYI
jgi:hypothetical protein